MAQRSLASALPPTWSRLNCSGTEGADVSERLAFWAGPGGEGGGGWCSGWPAGRQHREAASSPPPPARLGLGDRPVLWVGTVPVRCLDWAEPDLMPVPRAWHEAVASLLAHAGPSPPLPGGVRAPEQRGQHPFSRLPGPLCCPPAHWHPAGALAGWLCFGLSLS